MPTTFRIKICGVTTVDDALAVARAGADAVGLNFYPRSPRYIDVEQGRRIADALPPEVVKIGVFVNAPQGEVCRTFDRAGLDLAQIHGDEPPEFLSRLGDRPVIRAFRLGREPLPAVIDYLERCRRLACLPKMTLIDSHAKGAYGGTGTVADWSLLSAYRADDWLPPLVLAGGLRPGNVAEAIRTVRPAAVDTASGVESSPGRKSEALVKAFVEAAGEAFQSLG